MKTGIYHTENAGVYLTTPDTGILVDGIHDAGSVGFSPMTEREEEQIIKKEDPFSQLSGLLFTHLHIDHFKARKVTEVLTADPKLAVWGPGLEKRYLQDYAETDGNILFRIGDFSIFAYHTDHSGRLYQKEPHMSLLLRNDAEQETFLVSGDAVFYPEQAEKILGDVGKVDVIFVMIYQLIEKSSLQFLKALDPGRIILYHCPAPEDDTYQLQGLIRNTLKHGPFADRTVEVAEHHSRIP